MILRLIRDMDPARWLPTLGGFKLIRALDIMQPLSFIERLL